jgi:hypothetical protein
MIYSLLRRGTAIFILLCLIFTNILIYSGSASENPESLVDAEFSVIFITGTKLHVAVSMAAHKLTTDKAYSASEIASASDQDIGALRHSIFTLLKNQVIEVFNGSDITDFFMPIYQDGLFIEEFTVDLTSDFFNLNHSINSETLINGVLDCNAIVTYNFNLITEPGWNNTFKFILPETINITSANTDQVVAKTNTKEITWNVFWKGSSTSTQAVLSTKLSNPTTKPSEEQDISLVFHLDSKNVNDVGLSLDFSIKTIEIQSYNLLPSFISNLDFVPSDAVRLFIENGLLEWEEFYQQTIKPIEQVSLSVMQRSSFQQKPEMEFGWLEETSINCSTPYNITNMDSSPDLVAELVSVSPINLNICDISSRAFIGLVNAGAKTNITAADINFGDRFEEIGLPYEIYLYLPNGVYLDEENVFQWNESRYVFGDFTSELKPNPQYSEEKINTYIEIDILKADLNIPSFFTGTTEFTTTSYAKEETSYFIMQLPEIFSLPEKLNVPFLNSDGFRLCIQENVFSDEDVDAFLLEKKQGFENLISSVLSIEEIKGIINQDIFYHSQNWDNDISHMTASSPVITSVYTNTIHPMGFNLSVWPPRIDISNQTFTLSKMNNQTVTYTIIFPKGISVTAFDSTGNPLLIKNNAEGREYLEVLFSSSTDQQTMVVTCTLSASTLYMIAQFLPCIISFILVIILIVLVFLFKKKRKGRTVTLHEKPDSERYEEESYYVGPPR